VGEGALVQPPPSASFRVRSGSCSSPYLVDSTSDSEPNRLKRSVASGQRSASAAARSAVRCMLLLGGDFVRVDWNDACFGEQSCLEINCAGLAAAGEKERFSHAIHRDTWIPISEMNCEGRLAYP
jgi:hypothetical protein